MYSNGTLHVSFSNFLLFTHNSFGDLPVLNRVALGHSFKMCMTIPSIFIPVFDNGACCQWKQCCGECSYTWVRASLGWGAGAEFLGPGRWASLPGEMLVNRSPPTRRSAGQALVICVSSESPLVHILSWFSYCAVYLFFSIWRSYLFLIQISFQLHLWKIPLFSL